MDRNCFYKSIFIYLYNSQKYHIAIRILYLIEFIKNYDFSRKYALDLNEYFFAISTVKEWAIDFHIFILANALKKKLY